METGKTVRPRVVIIGAGFGGLRARGGCANEPVDVVLVDRRNYHLFTPLLYQVASCLLAPGEIAAPLRKVFRGAGNVRFRMGDVARIDFDAQHRAPRRRRRAPVRPSSCSRPAVARTTSATTISREHALGLKDLGEALQLRNHVLDCLERATSDDRSRRTAAPADVLHRRRRSDRRRVRGRARRARAAGASARVPGDRTSRRPHRAARRRRSAARRCSSPGCPRTRARELERRGVDVRTNALVAVRRRQARPDATTAREIETATMIWTAGVQPPSRSPWYAPAPHTARRSHRGRRVPPHPRHRRRVRDRRRRPRRTTGTGQRAPDDVAARDAGRSLRRQADPRHRGRGRPFRYVDKGTLATIGRTAAVGEVGPLRFTGFIGWIVWLVVHLYYLIGFENRLIVMLRWSWYYVRYDRPVRAIIRAHPPRRS